MRKQLTAGLVASLFTFSAVADEGVERVQKALKEKMPQVKVTSVKETPVDGLYEVVAGTEVVYLTEDGRYLLQGNLMDLEKQVNMTEQRRASLRLDLLDEVEEGQMVVYEPKGEVRHTVTVFTDTSCPYCRKLHKEVPELVENGVEVRYILYPRSRQGSPAYKTAVGAWCAEDTKAAVEQAMGGQSIDVEACNQNPISQNQMLAGKMGLRGTPFIVTDTGMAIPGYRPAGELIKALEASKAN